MKRLHQFLREQHTSPELIELIDTLLVACKEVAYLLKQGALAGILGSAGAENIQGETQKKLDVLSNDLLKKTLLSCNLVKGIASEEEDFPVAGNPNGKYLVTFDPLDGSSNIDVNVSVGTIFSILQAPTDLAGDDESAFLQQGSKQVAAGYVLYGPSNILVMTTGKGTHMFTLANTGDFFLTRELVQVPVTTKEFAINMSNQRFWEHAMQSYVDDMLKGEEGPLAKRYNMRWVASMVAEVHRILTRGGIFMYPYDYREPKKPGKLRLMYEGNPMSFLIEQAGGLSTNAYTHIMGIQPKGIHERVAVVLGSKDEVNIALDYHRRLAGSQQGD
ncbi:class 1 fructose-bisphosphatase [Pokkaliibacter sp. MBI-7]|uniref:Fructose-1,6-bisphosphatase class 1 n=1 Tax=Proteobacteria bacterium 228 TaxID=2083153 RepID=A0A2S5KVY5_9PROT|nr:MULTISPECIES: class 1 fructose-bisphosphatase [Pokkaliibacter]MDH2431880.1 class 1 fructose-bisphosphatase [Pokkaliibacter sp. MBI-7]PPC79007.1 class 1 fructose-bisphosphatase [Pokkaliibacter plantistimulans]